jgi:hypothetical protein
MALAPERRGRDTGGVLIYSYTFAPGTPEMWVERIERSTAGLEQAATGILSLAAQQTGAPLRGRLRIGPPTAGASSALIPICWVLPDLCGRLDGELRLSPVAADVTQISLRASYPSDGAASPDARHALTEFAAKALVDQVPLATGHALPGAPVTTAPIVPASVQGPPGA